MKALVTGATGFIGSNLVKRLQGAGWQLNLLIRPNSEFSSLMGKSTELVFGDILRPLSLKEAVDNIDIIFHLAAALPYHNLRETEYWQINVKGTRNLLEACKKRKIKRFVHISTVGIYGPPSAYSESKKRGEELVFSYYKKYKLPITIIRPTIAYGPADTRPGFLNLFRLIKKGIFIPIGKGDNFFHTIYIDNLIDALIMAATKDSAIGEDFIIGDDPCPRMSEILKTMYQISGSKFVKFYLPTPIALSVSPFFDFFRKVGLPSLLPTQRVMFLTEDKKFNIEKAKKLLGWKPKVTLTKGLKITYDWYKKNNFL